MKKIFMHIPKNGGKTLNSILNRFYQEDKTFAITEITPSKSNIGDFKSLTPEQRHQIQMLRGHMNFGIHEYFAEESKYFTLLRRPEERVVSFYYFVLRQPQHRLYQQVKDLSLLEFVKSVNPPDLNNGQIRFISGINDKEELMLEKALENIEKYFAFVGTLEKFDESLMFLKIIFNWPYPFYTIKNRTEKRMKLEEFPLQTLEIIKEYNRGDITLYEEISVQLENNIRKSLAVQSHLQIFQGLNKMYSKPVGKKIIKKLYYTHALTAHQKMMV